MNQGRLHHAYRLEGPDGVGKETAALELTKVLNCRAGRSIEIDGVSMPDSCDACGSCRKIAAGSHPDVTILAAEKGKAEIGIKQIRDLHGQVLYPPSEGEARVIIVREADRMTEEAANSFLKILEEPPQRTHYFLVTSRPHRLLSTISSRTIPIRFQPLGKDDLGAVLSGLMPERTADEIERIASGGGGSVSAAIATTGEEWAETLDRVVRLDSALMTGVRAVVELLDEMSLGRDGAYRLLTCLEMWYRDVAVIGVTGDREGLLLSGLADEAARRAESLSPALASTMALRIPSHRALLEGNVNPRMVIERLYTEILKDNL